MSTAVVELVVDVTTLRLTIDVLRPAWTGKRVAEGRLVKSARAVGLVECTITDGSDRLVAGASSTCVIPRGEAAAGR